MARTKAGIAIQQRMTQRELTQLAVAKALGRSQTWVSQSLLDDTERTIRRLWVSHPEAINRLLGLLDWDPASFHRATGLDIPIPPSDKDEVTLVNPDLRGGTRRIPVYDLLSAGPGGDGGTVIAEVDIPEAWKGDHAAYQVVGDSMSPRIPDGSTVIVRCQDYASPGNIIVAYSPEHGMLVKLFERATDDGQCVLTSFNAAYAPIWADTDELRVYGIVREVRTRIELLNGNGDEGHGPN